MDNEILNPNTVHEVMLACLYKADEIKDNQPPEGAILVEGITSNFGLHPGRVAESRGKIGALLRELPESFSDKNGDTFLNACVTRGGRHWGEHRDMQALMVLGVAAGFVWMLPRAFWPLCYGGMPIFGIKPDPQPADEIVDAEFTETTPAALPC